MHSTIPFQIIKPGYLFYDEDGETKVDLVGLKDAKFANADINSKLQMIEYLKNLRLIVWLLKKQNYLSYTGRILSRVSKSSLASHECDGVNPCQILIRANESLSLLHPCWKAAFLEIVESGTLDYICKFTGSSVGAKLTH
jgi:hypothetical protein